MTATLTNKAKSMTSDTWADATYTWTEAGSRTWENQTSITNKSKTAAATLTNKAKN